MVVMCACKALDYTVHLLRKKFKFGPPKKNGSSKNKSHITKKRRKSATEAIKNKKEKSTKNHLGIESSEIIADKTAGRAVH